MIHAAAQRISKLFIIVVLILKREREAEPTSWFHCFDGSFYLL